VHANAWWELIPAGIPREKLAVEGLNEPRVMPWGSELPEVTSAYYAELTRLMHLGGVRVVAGNLSVGWPGNGEPEMPPDSPPIWKGFVEMFDAIQEHHGYLGLHEYCYTNGPREPYVFNDRVFGGWGWWMGRFQVCPWDVPIVITEAGIDAHLLNKDYFGWHGLPEPRVPTFFGQMVDYEMQCILDGRVVAITPFTHDFYDPMWATYDTRPQELTKLWVAHARDMEAGRYTLPAPWPLPTWSSEPWRPEGPPPPVPMPPPAQPWEAVVSRWDLLVTEYAAKYDVSREVVHAIIILESGGDPNSINEESGAAGLMQVMPLPGRPTQAQLLDPETNIRWGCQILAEAIARHQSLEVALCAYGGVKEPSDLLSDNAQTYLRLFEKRWQETWPGMALPIVIPTPRLVDQAALIAARWFAEEAVRKIEGENYFEARALLLAQVIERLYTLAGDRSER